MALTKGEGKPAHGARGPTLSDCGPNVDPGKFMKLAQRVEMTLEKVVEEEPQQFDPDELLVSPCNRGGAPPLSLIHI